MQRPGRTGLDAGAAGHALGLEERLLLAGRDLRLEAAAPIVSANVPCISSQARTQREQTMHRSGRTRNTDCCIDRFGVRPMIGAVAARKRDSVMPTRGCHVLELAVAVGRAGLALSG